MSCSDIRLLVLFNNGKHIYMRKLNNLWVANGILNHNGRQMVIFHLNKKAWYFTIANWGGNSGSWLYSTFHLDPGQCFNLLQEQKRGQIMLELGSMIVLKDLYLLLKCFVLEVGHHESLSPYNLKDYLTNVLMS